jgi:hypothetical protein
MDAFSVELTLKGTQCLAIMYSGEAGVFSSTGFRAMVGDVVAQGDTPFLIADNGGLYEGRAMNWWVCDVPKGKHTIKIQFKPNSNLNSWIRNRTLMIFYSN